MAVLLPLFPAQAEPDAESLLRQTVDAMLAKGKGSFVWVGPDRSLEELQEDVEARPDDAEAFMKLGLRLILDDQIKSARNILERAVSIEPDSAPAHTLLAWVNMKEAGPLWNSAMANDIDSTLADNFFRLATEEFETAVRLDPQEKYIWVLWGVLEYVQSVGNDLSIPTMDPEPIIEKLRRAQGIDPSDSGVALFLGHVFYNYARVCMYVPRIEANMIGTNNNLPAWMIVDLRGQIIRYSTEAAAHYRTAIEDRPQLIRVHNRYVASLTNAGLYLEAVEAIENANAIFANDPKRRSKVITWESKLIEIMERQEASPEAIAKVRSAFSRHDSLPK